MLKLILMCFLSLVIFFIPFIYSSSAPALDVPHTVISDVHSGNLMVKGNTFRTNTMKFPGLNIRDVITTPTKAQENNKILADLTGPWTLKPLPGGKKLVGVSNIGYINARPLGKVLIVLMVNLN